MDFFDSSTSTIDTTFESTFESVDETRQKTEPQQRSNDFIEKIMLLYLKHNLTLVCLEDIMKLVNEKLEECNKLPTGKVQIMNMFQLHRDLVDIFYFVKCNKCQKYTKVDNKISVKCSRCSDGLKFTETNYFVSLPIEHQIVKSVKENWSAIQTFAIDRDRDTEKTMISDVYDGAILRKILEKYRDSDVNILSLTINVDGANKFKSNSKSVWPIQLVQNYLPPSIRFLPQNVIVNGLQYVSSKDDGTDDLNFREFLLPLVSELNSLKSHNIQIQIDNENYSFKPIITHAAVDLPAKSKFAEIKQCGGYDSCTFCEIPGEPVEIEVKRRAKGKASTAPNSGTALAKKPKTCVRYVVGDYKIRDEVETLRKMLLASVSNGKNPIDGVKDVSCLVGIEHFNIVWSFSVEYMHFGLLGVAKRFCNYFFNSKYSANNYYIAPRRRVALNKTILAIKPTSAIARKPRSINQRAYFKASEYRSLILYYLPVVLPGYVPNEYVKHIRVLSAALYTLLKEKISFEEIDSVEDMLKSFITEHQQLFGKANMVMVIHLLEHVAECVRKLGPLWAHSAFPFERNNGCLLKWVNGTSDVIHQISSKYALSKTIHKQKKADLNGTVLLGKSLNIKETATHVLSISSLEILNFSNINLFVHKRIRLKEVVYSSVMYTRPIRSIDYFIGLDSGHFGTAKYYFEANGQMYVMMNQFKKVDNIYHILKVKPTNRLVVAPVYEICKKYLFMNVGVNSYIVCPPNSYEKE